MIRTSVARFCATRRTAKALEWISLVFRIRGVITGRIAMCSSTGLSSPFAPPTKKTWRIVKKTSSALSTTSAGTLLNPMQKSELSAASKSTRRKTAKPSAGNHKALSRSSPTIQRTGDSAKADSPITQRLTSQSAQVLNQFPSWEKPFLRPINATPYIMPINVSFASKFLMAMKRSSTLRISLS